MAVMIKCKMCGGDLHITEGSTVCECEYCGTKQTVPTLDNEKKLTLFSRAGRLLRNCEFDKASGVFESIVAEFPEEAEAYWGLVLCKYGIEYVDDPATGKKIPTCHRSSFESVLEDQNYEQACENTDAVARRVYREEARQLEELRKSIIEVSGKEEPYDIFISYKETDENGNRTLDSVIAQDIYTELTEKGYRVFFSRISLEDKLGIEYEPYIFAALNSAKVMLVVGTDYENFDAVWVKNEWSRFLKLIASGQKKVLIPVFKNMDPYDMPKEFSKLAAQDMGKVGAMQDLLRGIDKLFGSKQSAPASKKAVNSATGNPTVSSLLERAFIFLEDGDFTKANEYAEKALDIEPRNAQAYLCKLMCSQQVKKKECLEQKAEPFENDPAYLKILQFGDDDFIRDIFGYNNSIKERIRKKEEAKEIKRLRAEQNKQKIELLKGKIADLQKLKSHPEQYLSENDREKYEELLKNWENADIEVAQQRGPFENVKWQLSKIEEEITTKKSYLSSLGFFRGNEKKAVQQEINKLENNRNSLVAQLRDMNLVFNEAEGKVNKAKTDYSVFCQTVLVSYNNEIDNQITEIDNQITTLSTENKVLEGHEAVIGCYHGELIEWYILTKENDKALLLSKYALDCQQYNNVYTEITWEKSSLRNWLNREFYNAAFSIEEQERILTTTVTADSVKYETNPGNETKDKIFLLSLPDVYKYLSSTIARQSKPSEYAKTQKCYIDNEYGNCIWWLRSPGFNQMCAAVVSERGEAFGVVKRVNECDIAVRPAMWISLDV